MTRFEKKIRRNNKIPLNGTRSKNDGNPYGCRQALMLLKRPLIFHVHDVWSFVLKYVKAFTLTRSFYHIRQAGRAKKKTLMQYFPN